MKLFGFDVDEFPWNLAPMKVNPIDGMPMILVPGGAFEMGPDHSRSDAPAHPIELTPFYMACTLVDFTRYKHFLKVCRDRDHRCSRSWPHRGFDEVEELMPATAINHFDATAYSSWAGGRLPTEAEWERTARGVSGSVPWCGADHPRTPSRLNVNANVCVSAFGVLQMSGNRLEWCADWHSENYYAKSPEKNPIGPESGARRVVRGGLQPSDPTRRYCDLPSESSDEIGFRYVMGI